MELNELEKYHELRIRVLGRLDGKAVERLLRAEEALQNWPHGIHVRPTWFCDVSFSLTGSLATPTYFRGYGLSPQEAFDRAITYASTFGTPRT